MKNLHFGVNPDATSFGYNVTRSDRAYISIIHCIRYRLEELAHLRAHGDGAGAFGGDIFVVIRLRAVVISIKKGITNSIQ